MGRQQEATPSFLRESESQPASGRFWIVEMEKEAHSSSIFCLSERCLAGEMSLVLQRFPDSFPSRLGRNSTPPGSC